MYHKLVYFCCAALIAGTSFVFAEEDQPQKIKIKIPSHLKNNHYSLMIDREEFNLDQDELELQPTLDSSSIKVFDAGGRLVESKSDYVDAELLEHIRIRKLRVSIQAGLVFASNSSEWDDAFLTGDRFQFGGALSWRIWKGFGIGLLAAIHTQSKKYDEGFVAEYFGTLLGSYFFYGWAPFRNAKGYWRTLSLIPAAGLVYGSHRAEISDDTLSLSERSSTIAPLGQVEFILPIVNNFGALLRYQILFQKIHLKKVGLDSNGPDHGLSLGGYYAF